ncbi:hypothetical protein C8R44DRAFT_147357 [Mycena epipterygia]|nr:hypothetical protein C8R44DRAFT_147357 [Mycena epipterygia]
MHQEILAFAPNLVQARIAIDFSDEAWPDPGAIIDLLHLQRLFATHGNVLDYLRAPVLQEIGFSAGLQEEDLDRLPHLDPFVLRSNCTLRRLSFYSSPSPHAAAEILRRYPSITELAILIRNMYSCWGRAAELISQLMIPNPTGGAVMSPKLSHISFGCYDDSSFDYALHLHMLQSRWKAADSDLKGAALLTSSGAGPDPETLRGLDVLRRDGIDLLVLQGMEASKQMDGWSYHPTWI